MTMDVTMMEEQARKKARRGTKSCTECRRRKVRCIRSPEDAKTCRRCEERGSTCVEQTYSSQPLHAQRVPSRHRISQLESKVTSLNKAIRNIEVKLGYQSSQTSEPTPAQPTSSNESNDESDDNSCMSDLLNTDPPSHLRSLFQNDWITVDTHRQNGHLQDRQAKVSAHLLDVAREALQKLIPSKDEFLGIASSASRWLTLLHTLLPQPFLCEFPQELLQSYDKMHDPDTDVITLASWLLIIAITTQQSPDEYDSLATQSKGYDRYSSFNRAVSDTVESTILSHDRLICTVPGLGMAMHLFRFQMSQGNFQKAWLQLRHIIALAELMGLPKAFQIIQQNRANGLADDETQLQRAQLWDIICAADGLSGMILNLPPCTRPYQQAKAQELAVDGVIQPGAYLGRLTDITTKIQYRDDISTRQGCHEAYASVLELDRKLRALASQTPKDWWTTNTENVKSDHVVQFLHHCTNMRVHLSFAMRQDPSDHFIYSRLACKEACESVAQSYQLLRRQLPSGIFLSHNLDLQAFTAAVVLLLTSHSSPYTNRSNLRISKTKVDGAVAKVITLMDEKAKVTGGSKFAQHGVATIRSLINLLQQDDEASELQELTLKVPLLGKIHIRRRSSTSRVSTANNLPSFLVPLNSGAENPNEHFALQEQGQLQISGDSHMASANQMQAEWQGDPLSWSIEGHYEDFFQDALIGEEIDTFSVWQNNYTGFQFNNV